MMTKQSKQKFETISGNEATARTAYMLTEAASIYPITPSSDMAEYCDQWSVGESGDSFEGFYYYPTESNEYFYFQFWV